MESIANNRHPLQRGGVSRGNRDLPAREPSYAPLDDRSEAALLTYWQALSKMVVYYDDSLRRGDWQAFFQKSLPVQLATIGQFDLSAARADFAQALENTQSGLDRNDSQPLFARVFALAQTIERWRAGLPDRTGLRAEIGNLIRDDLQFALQKLAALAQSAAKSGLLSDPTPFFRPFLGIPDWGLPSSGLLGTLPTARLRGTLAAKNAALQAELEAIFAIFAQALALIRERAPIFGQESLTFSDNAPHIGLMLTFSRLLQHFQGDLNSITARHLDFYFRQVLGITEKPFRPDSVHLVFELAKQASRLPLPLGTAFKDGKDKHKTEIHFTLPEDIVLNKAAIASLRTVFAHRNEAGDLQNLHAAPVANSADGAGAPFEDPVAATWRTLGSSASPAARFGFLLASPTLLLAEADGTVDVLLDLENLPDTSTASQLVHFLKIEYSGPKGWVEPPAGKVATLLFSPDDGVTYTKFQIKIMLDPGAPPLTFADAKILKEDYGTTDPLIKCSLRRPDGRDLKFYEDFVNQFNRLKKLEIEVTANRVRNLILQSDDGPLDPNKPFMPFGVQPKIGAGFYIGSEEVFRKKNLKKVKAELTFVRPANFTSYYANYVGTIPTSDGVFDIESTFLQNGKWLTALPAPISSDMFGPATVATDGSQKTNWDLLKTDFVQAQALSEPLTILTNLTQTGFFRVKMSGGNFLHDKYAESVTKAVVDAANNTSASTTTPKTVVSPVTVNPPYTPLAKDLFLNYIATAAWSPGQQSDLQFFHLLPFEASNRLEPKPAPGQTTVPFLPLPTDEGTLYIGVRDLVPGGNLSLLFQLAEASADPDAVVRLPDGSLRRPSWQYLRGNAWGVLEPDFNILADDTAGLLRSGVVKLAIPFDASSAGATQLPTDLFWLKVSLPDRSAGASSAFGVFAQAAKATFKPDLEKTPELPDGKSDLTRLAETLPAGSVVKPVDEMADLKSVSQPYPAFGARPKEASEAFYRRVSEQLRHKGRGVALYDYERLILEEFPEIFRVKCLPHTHARPNGDLYRAPGHTTLIVIPDTSGFGFSERLQPKASAATLDRIDAFLKKRISPFVRLHVVNPKYETVRVAGKVVFRPGKDAAFYLDKLEKDIVEFLTPWAFGGLDKLTFGGKIFRSSILQFVEQRDYVEYVTDFELFDSKGNPGPVAEAQTERSILVFGSSGIENLASPPGPPRPVLPGKSGLGYAPINTLSILELPAYESDAPCGPDIVMDESKN